MASLAEFCSSNKIQELPSHCRPTHPRGLFSALENYDLWLGSHSWTHANLPALSDSEIEQELVSAREWIAREGKNWVNWVAYPYGSVDERVTSVASGLHEGGFLSGGGLAIAKGRWRSTHFLAPRINIPSGLSLDGFRLRASGLLRA